MRPSVAGSGGAGHALFFPTACPSWSTLTNGIGEDLIGAGAVAEIEQLDCGWAVFAAGFDDDLLGVVDEFVSLDHGHGWSQAAKGFASAHDSNLTLFDGNGGFSVAFKRPMRIAAELPSFGLAGLARVCVAKGRAPDAGDTRDEGDPQQDPQTLLRFHPVARVSVADQYSTTLSARKIHPASPATRRY